MWLEGQSKSRLKRAAGRLRRPPSETGRLVVRGYAMLIVAVCGTVCHDPAHAQDDKHDLAQIPSFLGADSLKALEAARAEREAEVHKLAPPVTQTPASPPLAAPAPAAKIDRRKALEEEAKRRAETMKRLAPEGGVKHLSPHEVELLEAENAAKARADQRARELAAGLAPTDDHAASGTVTTSDPAASAAALGQAAAEVKALLKDAGAPAASPRGPSVTLMEKLPTPAEAPAQSAQRSPSGKLTSPLPAEAPASPQPQPQPSAPVFASCPAAKVSAQPLSAGRMRIDIDSACRAGEPVAVLYGDVRFERALDKAGQLAFVLDLFRGRDGSVAIDFKDQTRLPVDIVANDLDKVSKVAVLWRSPVNLDLHAFEYASIDGKTGHVWAGQPESAETALALAKSEGRGHGFLSFQSDASGGGDKLEVYTFWHVPGQDSGIVTLAVDNATRGSNPAGESCGTGALASVDMRVWRMLRGGTAESEDRILASVPCGRSLPLDVRYNPDSMPSLKAR